MKGHHDNIKDSLEDEFISFKKVAPYADVEMFKEQQKDYESRCRAAPKPDAGDKKDSKESKSEKKTPAIATNNEAQEAPKLPKDA